MAEFKASNKKADQWRAMADELANKLRDVDDLHPHELETLARYEALKGQSK